VVKGFIWLGILFVSASVPPHVGGVAVCAAAILDSYMVGKKLASGKPVGKMDWFPR